MTSTSATAPSEPTQSELLTVTAARDLADAGVVFAGIGLPTLAVSLAQETVAPHLEVVYESGVTGAHPAYLPATIADSVLITGAEAVLTLPAVFGYVLQGGRIDVGFLGAAQIDKYGSLNSSVIGEWQKPLKRLPGSGGAHDVMACAKEVHVIMRRHTPAAFVSELDFCTTPGPERALQAGGSAHGRGVTKVYTELGVLSRSEVGEELALTAVNRGVTPEDVIAATGWPLKVSDDLHVLAAPDPDELRILREELDPGRIYLR
jgi:glutaconate CoA-transferase subunit B